MIKQLRSSNKQLEEALRKRDELIKEKPELEEFQKVIEGVLTKAGKNVQNREAALIRLTLTQLHENAKKIQEITKKISTE